MYNGVGVQTARGTGTSGYVQANLSALNFSRQRKAYNNEEDIAKAEAEVNKKPNLELLDHEYKRRIEIKCVELQDLMEQEKRRKRKHKKSKKESSSKKSKKSHRH